MNLVDLSNYNLCKIRFYYSKRYRTYLYSITDFINIVFSLNYDNEYGSKLFEEIKGELRDKDFDYSLLTEEMEEIEMNNNRIKILSYMRMNFESINMDNYMNNNKDINNSSKQDILNEISLGLKPLKPLIYICFEDQLEYLYKHIIKYSKKIVINNLIFISKSNTDDYKNYFNSLKDSKLIFESIDID